jgi:hypothetical protein
VSLAARALKKKPRTIACTIIGPFWVLPSPVFIF